MCTMRTLIIIRVHVKLCIWWAEKQLLSIFRELRTIVHACKRSMGCRNIRTAVIDVFYKYALCRTYTYDVCITLVPADICSWSATSTYRPIVTSVPTYILLYYDICITHKRYTQYIIIIIHQTTAVVIIYHVGHTLGFLTVMYFVYCICLNARVWRLYTRSLLYKL